jgi:hypothetical protein
MPCRLVQEGAGATLPVIYTVSDAVGPSAPNDRLDVMLVQFFLSIFAFSGRLAVDGQFGPDTYQNVRHFQLRWRQISAQHHMALPAIDGRVSPATTMGYRRGNEVVAYTMAALNLQFKTLYPSQFMALRQQPDFPEELRSPSAWSLVPPQMR